MLCYAPSSEEQRRAVEAQRNRRRLERYRNIRQYRSAFRTVETFNRAHR
ncbi:MAG: hypothetical protein AAB304_01600 [Pseudomonadota bacterium]